MDNLGSEGPTDAMIKPVGPLSKKQFRRQINQMIKSGFDYGEAYRIARETPEEIGKLIDAKNQERVRSKLNETVQNFNFQEALKKVSRSGAKAAEWMLANGFTEREAIALADNRHMKSFKNGPLFAEADSTDASVENSKGETAFIVRVVHGDYPRTRMKSRHVLTIKGFIKRSSQQLHAAGAAMKPRLGQKFFVEGYLIVICYDKKTVEWVRECLKSPPPMAPWKNDRLRTITEKHLLECSNIEAKQERRRGRQRGKNSNCSTLLSNEEVSNKSKPPKKKSKAQLDQYSGQNLSSLDTVDQHYDSDNCSDYQKSSSYKSDEESVSSSGRYGELERVPDLFEQPNDSYNKTTDRLGGNENRQSSDRCYDRFTGEDDQSRVVDHPDDDPYNDRNHRKSNNRFECATGGHSSDRPIGNKTTFGSVGQFNSETFDRSYDRRSNDHFERDGGRKARSYDRFANKSEYVVTQCDGDPYDRRDNRTSDRFGYSESNQLHDRYYPGFPKTCEQLKRDDVAYDRRGNQTSNDRLRDNRESQYSVAYHGSCEQRKYASGRFEDPYRVGGNDQNRLTDRPFHAASSDRMNNIVDQFNDDRYKHTDNRISNDRVRSDFDNLSSDRHHDGFSSASDQLKFDRDRYDRKGSRSSSDHVRSDEKRQLNDHRYDEFASTGGQLPYSVGRNVGSYHGGSENRRSLYGCEYSRRSPAGDSRYSGFTSTYDQPKYIVNDSNRNGAASCEPRRYNENHTGSSFSYTRRN